MFWFTCYQEFIKYGRQNMNSKIQDDSTALESIKEPSRAKYAKVFDNFKNFTGAGDELNLRLPSEEEVLAFVNYLRKDKGAASSSMWTIYSMLNSVIKSKYGFNLKSFPRVTTLIKSFDVDIKKKAAVFSKEDTNTFISSQELVTPYWLVRKVTN